MGSKGLRERTENAGEGDGLFTQADKEELVQAVLAALPDGDTEAY